MSIVYTLSDRGRLVKEVIRSLKSLCPFAKRKDITIFLTPPRKKNTARELSKYGNVIEAPNITKPFVFDPARGLGYYGEKIHLCEVDTPELSF